MEPLPKSQVQVVVALTPVELFLRSIVNGAQPPAELRVKSARNWAFKNLKLRQDSESKRIKRLMVSMLVAMRDGGGLKYKEGWVVMQAAWW